MSTIKSDRKDFEMLLNGLAPLNTGKKADVPTPTPTPATSVSSVAANIDNAGDNFPIEKLFEYDYETSKKTLRKRARKTVNNILKHILPESMLEEDYIKDKMEQDINTLADLYFQVELNSIMQRSLVENVSRGNTMPRMYEVFSGLTDRIQALNKQIVSTEQQIRRTYMDLKIEIREKNMEKTEAISISEHQALENGENKRGIMVSSSKQLIEMASKKHLEKMRAAQEAEYVEEK